MWAYFEDDKTEKSEKNFAHFITPVHQSGNAQEGVVINTVWFLHSSLELGMFFKRRYKTINESPP